MNLRPLILLLISCFFAPALLCARDSIIIYGSDLLKPVLEPIIQEFSEDSGVECKLHLTGTLQAKKALKEGATDIAIIAVLEKQTFNPYNYSTLPFAHLAAAIVVNKDNPIQEITLQQLKNIYGDVGSTEFTEWSQVGLSGIWTSRAINAFASTENKAMALSLLNYTILNDKMINDRVSSLDDRNELIKTIANEASSIAVMRAPVNHPDIKVLPITTSSQDKLNYSSTPTEENLVSEDYPLKLKFITVYDPSKQFLLAGLFNRLYEAPTPDLLRENQFIPLPERELERIVLDLDIGL